MSSSNVRSAPRLIGAVLLLLTLVATTYRDAPDNGFHLDDGRNIHQYPPVMVTDLTVANVVDAGRNALLPTRPLPSMTFAIDWARGGGAARTFQQTNIAIHGATAVAVLVLLYLLLGRLGYPPAVRVTASFLGAALWACHPIQVQAVTYIVQRMTSMAAFFTILTVICYMLGRQSHEASRRWLLYGAGALCWVFGLASKETAAIAPFLVLLVEYAVLRHGEPLVRNRLDLGLLAIPALVAFFVVVDIASGAGPLSQSFLGGYANRDFTLAERLLTQPRVIAMHLSQILWPVPGRFSLEHDMSISTGLLAPPVTLLAFVGLITWCGVGVWLLFRPAMRIAGALILWVPATLAIESSFIPLEMVFEHRMYLPTVGLAGIAAMACGWSLQQGRRRAVVAAGLFSVAVLALVLSTGRYVPVWKDSLTLAENSVKAAPGSARAWSTVAHVHYNQGRGWSSVAAPLQRALELNPRDPTALNLSALRLIEGGNLAEAQRVVMQLEPKASRDLSIVNTIGMLRLAQGKLEASVSEFKKATTLNPYEPVFQYNLALSYELSGRCEAAVAEWSKFLSMATDERQITAVRQRLARNFSIEGGRCFKGPH